MIFGTGVLMRGKGASGGRSEKDAAMESLASSILAGCAGVAGLCFDDRSASGSAVKALSQPTRGPGGAAVVITPSSQRQLDLRAAGVELSPSCNGLLSSKSSCGALGSSLCRLRT